MLKLDNKNLLRTEYLQTQNSPLTSLFNFKGKNSNFAMMVEDIILKGTSIVSGQVDIFFVCDRSAESETSNKEISNKFKEKGIL